MATMVITIVMPRNDKQKKNSHRITACVLLCSIVVAARQCYAAADWKTNYSLGLREIYSDNIDLDSANEDSDFVTEVTPGVTLVADGNRLDWELGYSVQGSVACLKTAAATQ